MAEYVDIDAIYSKNSLSGYKLEYDEFAVKNSLLNIFTINKGEVPGKPGFGNPMDITLFDLFTFFNVKDMETAIGNAIARYEPRVNLSKITIIEAPEYNRLIIQLEYSFVVQDGIYYDTLEIPYSHNAISFLGGRTHPPESKSQNTECTMN